LKNSTSDNSPKGGKEVLFYPHFFPLKRKPKTPLEGKEKWGNLIMGLWLLRMSLERSPNGGKMVRKFTLQLLKTKKVR
jgi:hypothetical protein